VLFFAPPFAAALFVAAPAVVARLALVRLAADFRPAAFPAALVVAIPSPLL
jgi:hypothetical protein